MTAYLYGGLYLRERDMETLRTLAEQGDEDAQHVVEHADLVPDDPERLPTRVALQPASNRGEQESPFGVCNNCGTHTLLNASGLCRGCTARALQRATQRNSGCPR